MKTRPTVSVLTTVLLLFSGGCGFFQGDDATEEQSLDQAPIRPPEVPVQPVKQLPPVDIASLGLIAPVQPSERRPKIAAGRPNPFALIPVKATVRESVCRIEDRQEDAGNNKAVKTATSSAQPKPVQPGRRSQAPSTSGSPEGNSPNVTAPPPAPLYPNDARAVEVSGVVEIQNRPYAIVKAPGEPVARNVTVGDRLSGGKIRVKAINANSRLPQVTLEEYGQTVTRRVGDPPLPPLTPSSTNPSIRGGSIGDMDEDGMITITAPDGTVIRVPAEVAQQEVRRQEAIARRSSQRRLSQQVTAVPLTSGEEAGVGFGEIRNLAVLKLNAKKQGNQFIGSSGVICNTGNQVLAVRRLTLQVEDTENNTILDSIGISLGQVYRLQKGQKLEFDGSVPDFRGRSPENIIVRLVDWQSTARDTNRNNN